MHDRIVTRNRTLSMSDLIAFESRTTAIVPVVRHRGRQTAATTDQIAQEWPVAIVCNGISHAVMMCTPADLEAFALGFALTEGLVARRSDVVELEIEWHERSAEIQMTLVQQAFSELKVKRRSLAGRSGCGVCGIESIEMLDLEAEPIEPGTFLANLDPGAVARAAAALPDRQVLQKQTGGVHAAAWCNAAGDIVHVCEDVGRHNALDKLIGKIAFARESTQEGFVFLSSRASYELIRKAARVDVPMIATISAPTSLAINIAKQAGIRLVAFCRGDGFVEYASA
jgi:FdhD protein